MLGGILTAAVTPMRADGSLDEDAFSALLVHLRENGSNGVVVAGTTGEGPTLEDAEKERLFEVAVAEKGDMTVIAGTGSNDTAHTVRLTGRAGDLGCDAALVVAPYYNKPNRRGLIAHFEAAAAPGLPIVIYNIPSRCVIDMPNDLLAELGQQEAFVAVKQARYEDFGPIDGLDLLAGNDDVLGKTMEAGGTGGITVASHIVGPEMRRIVDEPDARAEVEESLRAVYEAMAVAVNPIPVKTAMAMLGHEVGPFRLPLVDASEQERAVIRAALEARGLLSAV